MILTSNFNCIVGPVADKASTAMQCTGEIVTAVSGWDVFTTVANWLILAVAAGALIVSERSRRDSRAAMKATLEASDKATQTQIELSRETLDASYKASQAQLDASHEATRADLDERRNARELDVTASFINALTELLMTATRNVDEEGRGMALRQASNNTLLAASRYDLFIGSSSALNKFQRIFLKMLKDYEPRGLHDWNNRKFERLSRVHSVLREEIFEYQKSKQISSDFSGILGAMTLMENDGGTALDQVLGLTPADD